MSSGPELTRRSFIISSAALAGTSLFPAAGDAFAPIGDFDPYEFFDWNNYLSEPIAVPEKYIPAARLNSLRQLLDPPTNPEQDWPIQKTPDFDLVIDHQSGIRPFGRRGFRLETERILDNTKLVVHNYGHGGAGMTLSWGVAELAADKLSHLPRGTEVAVLGGGVIGLSTAYVLIERGFKVRVYAEKFYPHAITSAVAGAQFAPSIVRMPPGIELNDIILRSWKRFAKLEDTAVGVSYRPNFSTSSGSMFNKFPEGTIPGGRAYRLDKLPFDHRPRRGSYTWTFLIEPPIYLSWLMRELHSLGVDFVQARFASHYDLAALPENVLVNSLGMGAKALFNDRNLKGIRGEVVLLKPQNLNYLLAYSGGYVFDRKDSVVLGGTFEYGVEENVTTTEGFNRIMRRNRRFFR